MNSVNFGGWNYELVCDRQLQLQKEAALQRLLDATRPPAKRRLVWQPPLALLRTWRLVVPWLQWSSPADETLCS